MKRMNHPPRPKPLAALLVVAAAALVALDYNNKRHTPTISLSVIALTFVDQLDADGFFTVAPLTVTTAGQSRTNIFYTANVSLTGVLFPRTVAWIKPPQKHLTEEGHFMTR
jgi:hypothetical protein